MERGEHDGMREDGWDDADRFAMRSSSARTRSVRRRIVIGAVVGYLFVAVTAVGTAIRDDLGSALYISIPSAVPVTALAAFALLLTHPAAVSAAPPRRRRR